MIPARLISGDPDIGTWKALPSLAASKPFEANIGLIASWAVASITLQGKLA